jgi:hypothetical protein
MKRIGIGGIAIESCTFSPLRTQRADFHEVLRGPDMLVRYSFLAAGAGVGDTQRHQPDRAGLCAGVNFSYFSLSWRLSNLRRPWRKRGNANHPDFFRARPWNCRRPVR